MASTAAPYTTAIVPRATAALAPSLLLIAATAAFPVAVTVAVTVNDTETVTVALPSAPQEADPVLVLKAIPAPAVPAPEFVPVTTALPPAGSAPPPPPLDDKPATAGAPGYELPDEDGP